MIFVLLSFMLLSIRTTNQFCLHLDVALKAAMSPDGVDEIVDQKIVGTCNPEEVRNLASIAHRCLLKKPRKRPSIAEVSQAILKIKQRRLNKEDTMSLAGEEFSRMVTHIQQQQLELTNIRVHQMQG